MIAVVGWAYGQAKTANALFAVELDTMQNDEFRCSRCFLVHHRSQLAYERDGDLICKECA